MAGWTAVHSHFQQPTYLHTLPIRALDMVCVCSILYLGGTLVSLDTVGSLEQCGTYSSLCGNCAEGKYLCLRPKTSPSETRYVPLL
jgi:hypothetical protein